MLLNSTPFILKSICRLITVLFLSVLFLAAHSQQGTEVELEKPKKYENRRLASEKTGEKKFTVPRKVYQNTVTHYNYYFNANNRLNDLVNRAKTSFKDDYSELLPFYNYSLHATSQDKTELDSIIYKCTAGILLHDLRNSWIDNLYLILAKAYFFRKDQDSAGLTLQYLNFSFAPKEPGGYDVPIGSNSSNDIGEFSIATKEKNSIWNKLTSRPPSRNESFIWQVRNHIEKDELPEAAGVIEILRNDPNFPKRLHTDLEEVLAYWFYKQQVYDSAAFHLSNALDEAATGQEKARWEYLIGQMYQLANKNEEAVDYYNRSIKHTTDPVMDIYARLNSIRINRTDTKDYLQNNIDALHQMAKRDKYEDYRDIIYYASATIELERNKFTNAQDDLLKSVKYSSNNPAQRSQSFMLLGDLNFNRKAYPPASAFYDSVDVNILTGDDNKSRVNTRRPALKIIAVNTENITTEDSLQALAKMPAEQRDALVKKLAKQLRKEQGLKDEDIDPSNPAVRQQAPDLFASNEKSNDFYFYNASQKSRGFSEFKSKWGARPNIDNWRRLNAVTRQNLNPALNNIDKSVTSATNKSTPTSYEELMESIPLTPEKINESNKKVMDALFTLAQTLINKLEDYPSAIQAYEELLRRFPNTPDKEEVLFNLANAYQKTGDKEKADYYKRALIAASPNGKLAQLIQNPSIVKKNPQATPATKKYEEIYNLFIEGDFSRAKTEKKIADSLYGNSYWTPQLLFIESIYYIKQKDDSTAIKVLTNLTSLYGTNPMAERAKTMIDVLKRRGQIEEDLAKLDVTRNESLRTNMPVDNTTVTKPIDQRPVTTTPKVDDKKATTQIIVKPELPAIKKDTVVTPPPAVKKDTVVTSLPAVKKDTVVTPLLAVKKDTVVTPPPAVKKDTVIAPPSPTVTIKKDTAVTPSAPTVTVKGFSFIPTDPQYVVVLMDKVDEVYASEGRNAFNRYNRERFNNQPITMGSLKLDDRFNLVLQGPFNDAKAAVDYLDKVRPVAGSRILPWLSADKYSFIIISTANLDLLKTNKDMTAYKQLLKQAFPEKF
jgi:tetratricopeptide (TPR) repeat protein